MQGKIHSFQSFSTEDGPGIRCVVFLQGCPLRCMYCHNPDTWDFQGGSEIELEALFQKIVRCKPYFGEEGGVTVSGGEVLYQAPFATKLLQRCKEAGIHTCIETSGSLLTDDVKELLFYTDLVYLDVKMVTESDYLQFVGTSLAKVMTFLEYLQETKKPTIVRQVILENFNDSDIHIRKLKALLEPYTVIQKVEFLPYHNLGNQKYEELGIESRAKEYQPTSLDTIRRIESYYNSLK